MFNILFIQVCIEQANVHCKCRDGVYVQTTVYNDAMKCVYK